MSLAECFEIDPVAREKFIAENIVALLPETERIEGKKRATTIVSNFVGADMDAISILGYAAERGRFNEFAEKLKRYYDWNLKYVHPEARRVAMIPGAIRATQFFLKCYEEMGIQPRQPVETANA